jgi:lipopolysaccharide/colanic/teichoic acid biosynthesis glycosyltransferase
MKPVQPMKIVITGATGFVGQALVGQLRARGCSLLLAGRDTDRLAALFPGIDVCGYTRLVDRMAGYDMLVHLPVINSDATCGDEDFFSVNVDFTIEIASMARSAGVGRFINLSSAHALDPENRSAYARSKRACTEKLEALGGLRTQTVYLPLVYGDRWPSKLAFLNRLPHPLARVVFTLLAALKPSVQIDRLSEFLLTKAKPTPDREIILFDDQDRNPFYRWTKRGMDLLFAVAVIALLGWALVLIWIAIRIESPGPGLFAQARVGRGGQVFTCYKFRTMKQGTRQAGTHEVSATAITRLGNFMRKTKIDELPQVINILRNEVSLIGPRPCLPVQKELVAARKERGVLTIKPGISGLAQINDIDMSDPQKLARWDARYVGLRSLLLDLKITIATATGRGQGDKTSPKM